MSAIPVLVCFVIAILHVVLVFVVVVTGLDDPLIKYSFSFAAPLPNPRRLPLRELDRDWTNRQINQGAGTLKLNDFMRTRRSQA